MNLNKLDAFILVVEKGSFSESAAALHSSQPAISLKIKSLEEDLGFELLDRGASGIHLTPAGALVYQAAKEMIKTWRRLEDDLVGFQDTLTGNLTIGASTIPGTYLVPAMIKRFRDRFPKVDVSIEISDSEETLKKLLNQQIDAAIVGMQPTAAKLNSQKLATDSLVLITPTHHPLLETGDPAVNELQHYEFVVREKGSGTRKRMEEYLAAHDLVLDNLPISLSIGSTEGVIAAVEAGLGISFVSKLAAQPAVNANRVRVIEKINPIQRSFYFTVLKETENRPIIKELTNVLISHEPLEERET
ncbi:selenium metabolism-associated LysR family transcriptional regulator [Neobacillus dielmonensis]|uniref:selenium metabolism-associated LysR family transcriptional regulator n=1 Tax=Neobacillus dielmonensis TaxID=1347369 RepID=UPI0006940792|nr:selenium metabolism-associated LysR family transcriptional regulator [Neobacillus dielmonensis]